MPDPTPLHRASERSVRVDRRIAADPASAALLCSGPAAAELWPGVRREADDVVVLTRGRRRGSSLRLRTTAPRRTPTAFVCAFEVGEGGRRRLTGRLELAYESGGGGTPATRARLLVDPDGLARADEQEITRGAERFLANLARAAEVRAGAA